ncbi:rod-binding protein [Defluviimonas sp. WL0075]|uniref:Rod-binding protein n=1 Tax=Albidovulum sediminicola TaxID=2984331 RepID=A0ABT2Z4Z1_9RHOB|nr:rod-binding protein [Defluviimonas sp. WL0075]MCV2866095.1 rod-binding protein [Defluviimonas sp. WL0075]
MNIDGPGPLSSATSTACGALRVAASELETSFLEEMLQHAGLGDQSGAFSGGVGEAQFASLLRHEQAAALTEAGGIGLAQRIFDHLAERSGCDR